MMTGFRIPNRGVTTETVDRSSAKSEVVNSSISQDRRELDEDAADESLMEFCKPIEFYSIMKHRFTHLVGPCARFSDCFPSPFLCRKLPLKELRDYFRVSLFLPAALFPSAFTELQDRCCSSEEVLTKSKRPRFDSHETN